MSSECRNDNANNDSNTEKSNKPSSDELFDVRHSFIINVNYLNKPVKIVIATWTIYLLWIYLHYFASHLYIEYCVPHTIKGFIMSPFMVSTPHCKGLRWIIYNGGNNITNMWSLVGTWIYARLIV
jgi:hypothetical protein